MLIFYIMILGTGFLAIGLAEFVMPVKIFMIWKKWVNHKMFPVHGLFLILVGFPLTIYSGPISWVIFSIGLIIVFTGPFILLYPERMRMVFGSIQTAPDDEKSVKKIMYLDGVTRLVLGFTLAACYFINIYGN